MIRALEIYLLVSGVFSLWFLGLVTLGVYRTDKATQKLRNGSDDGVRFRHSIT